MGSIQAIFATLGCLHMAGAEIQLYVRSQGLAHQTMAMNELLAAVVEAGWPHTSVVSMKDAEEELRHGGLWSYFPWIWLSEKKRLKSKRSARGGRWLVFLEASTMVAPKVLGQLLSAYDAREAWYLGRALKDEQMSIIHHYQQEPPYPLAHAGFALSGGLLRKLVLDLEEKPLGGGQQIEPVWELASRLSKMGIAITDHRGFCLEAATGCATWARSLEPFRPSMGLTAAELVIAVKTVEKFHSVRLPLLKEFWTDESAVEVLYLSNTKSHCVQEADLGCNDLVDIIDLSLEFGDMVDPSKESNKQGSGHCTKMQAILRYLHRSRPSRRWYVVTDDDTLVNVPRLLRVLDSHDDSLAIYLGERYGWSHMQDRDGTNYITTGAGMALSNAALQRLMSCSTCNCRAPDAPDDMSLGTWFRNLGIEATHEEGFHQSEPQNYHKELLGASDPPVSFHRFNARLPGSASAEEFHEARRQSWSSWRKNYFKQEL
ncbi:unnamed protein product [Cladocopium goreaui]|uniref:Fringe-like glycosyltransferase domain-containing protein n=1 Tax=Cladocopium goreaui TaxID=2562237 RepID=A0A9P1DV31_9DINO|nr:unnamed protein product [Cladocopium goreaui]